MPNVIKWFRKRFKTVYCNECEHRSDTEWYGYYSCLVSHMTVVTRAGSLYERPKTEILHGNCQCRNVKHFSWCKKFKSKG